MAAKDDELNDLRNEWRRETREWLKNHEDRIAALETVRTESKTRWAFIIGGSGFAGTVATEALIHWLFK